MARHRRCRYRCADRVSKKQNDVTLTAVKPPARLAAVIEITVSRIFLKSLTGEGYINGGSSGESFGDRPD
jgi:hypothetical protein